MTVKTMTELAISAQEFENNSFTPAMVSYYASQFDESTDVLVANALNNVRVLVKEEVDVLDGVFKLRQEITNAEFVDVDTCSFVLDLFDAVAESELACYDKSVEEAESELI